MLVIIILLLLFIIYIYSVKKVTLANMGPPEQSLTLQ